MAVVTEHLIHLIAKQVEDHALVVWYDPERHYRAVAADLDPAEHDRSPATTARFLQLRREIDPLLNDLHPPRLVVYVPMDQGDTDHALVELEAAGVVVQPGQQPPNRNTRLSLVARNALRPLRGEANAAEIEKQVEAGKLNLADLDAIGEKKDSGVLSLIFGTGNPQEVALGFVAGSRFDAEIEKKSARGELTDLLQSTVEIDLPNNIPLPEMRDRLARHILLTDLVVGLGDSLPASLASLKVATSPGARDACKELARNWRLRRDVRDSYVTASRSVEEQSSLGQIRVRRRDTIAEVETFACLERALLRNVEETLQGGATRDLLALTTARLSRFWSEVTPTDSGALGAPRRRRRGAARSRSGRQGAQESPEDGPRARQSLCRGRIRPGACSTRTTGTWRAAGTTSSPTRQIRHPGLEKLITKAEQRYTEVGSQLAKHFVTQFQKAKHPIKGVLRQCEIFEKQVKPRLGEGKIAYVWVDALRFEMARELGEVLKEDFDLTLQPAIGTMPTITEIGMASLLPKADQGARWCRWAVASSALEIAGTVIKDRKDRIAFLKEHAGVSGLRRQAGRPAAQAIEEGEGRHPGARSDPGHLAGDRRTRRGGQHRASSAPDGRRAERPCGGAFASPGRPRDQDDRPRRRSRAPVRRRDRRGHEDRGTWRRDGRPASAGLGGRWRNLGAVVPADLAAARASTAISTLPRPGRFACFKSKGGARAYFHGGLSPQELIVPVVVMTSTAQALSKPPTGIQWTLTPGSKKLTTRFFSVQIAAAQSSRACSSLNRRRCGSNCGPTRSASRMPVSASYGFEDATGEVTAEGCRQMTRQNRTEHRHRDDRLRRSPEDGGRLPARCHDRG